MWVELTDGRTLGIPLSWYPRLQRASSEARMDYWIGYDGEGIHWEAADEDISVAGLLAGRRDQTRLGQQAEAAEKAAAIAAE